MPLKPLIHPDNLHLRAAVGWLELGNHIESGEELERIRPEWRAHPDVLDMRCLIYYAAKKWDNALAVAEELTKTVPDDDRGWIHLCRALYFTNRIKHAYDIATRKLPSFPRNWELHYDTACYACLLGRLKETENFLLRAFKLGDTEQIKSLALADPNLDALWKSILSFPSLGSIEAVLV
ncbi:MAG: tetratricopeptide repeat protein [Pedosphaera sp.]|nr:tetratricopeptide repeat protein [Pedosphaera sp.]